MKQDDKVCLCFSVSKRKIVSFCKREKPRKVSQLSNCLGAGTGCGWCIPFLQKIHTQVQEGVACPDLEMAPETYVKQRLDYQARKREAESTKSDAEQS